MSDLKTTINASNATIRVCKVVFRALGTQVTQLFQPHKPGFKH
jgi:hypothetical protein